MSHFVLETHALVEELLQQLAFPLMELHFVFCEHSQSLNHQLFENPCTQPAGSSIHSFDQECWSWLSFPTPSGSPNSGIKPLVSCIVEWILYY